MDGGYLRPEEVAQAPASYFRFTAIRNPYDRFVSGWKYCEHTKNRPMIEVLRNMPVYSQVPNSAEDPTTESFAWWHITMPQYRRVVMADGCTLGVDFAVRYENLKDDFDHVCDIIGRPRVELPVVNKTDHMRYKTYFDGDMEAQKLLAGHFQRDLELFEYSY